MHKYGEVWVAPFVFKDNPKGIVCAHSSLLQFWGFSLRHKQSDFIDLIFLRNSNHLQLDTFNKLRNLVFFILIREFQLYIAQLCCYMSRFNFNLWYLESIVICHWLDFIIAFFDEFQRFFQIFLRFCHQNEHLTTFLKAINSYHKVIFRNVISNKNLTPLFSRQRLKTRDFASAKMHNFTRNVVEGIRQLNFFVQSSIKHHLIMFY